jgi:hypothetical protein
MLPNSAVLLQHHSVDDGSSGDVIIIWAQQWPAWKVALLMCSTNRMQHQLGGRPSIVLPFCFRASLTLGWLLVRSYCAMQVGCQAASCKVYVNCTPHNRKMHTLWWKYSTSDYRVLLHGDWQCTLTTMQPAKHNYNRTVTGAPGIPQL